MNQDPSLLETLSSALTTVLLRPIEIMDYRRLSGGISNRSYLVTLHDAEYVVRLKRTGVAKVLDLGDEYALMLHAARAGIGPELAGFDPSCGALVTVYLHRARPWSQESARETANIIRMASLLHRLHQIEAAVPAFDCEYAVSNYLHALGSIDALVVSDQHLAAELSNLAAQFARHYPCTAVCHNDLVPANILDDGSLTLVDYEYAVFAAPVLDLASLAAMCGFHHEHCRALLDAYYADRTKSITALEFAKVVRMLQLMAYFWALASAKQAADPDRYAAYLERPGMTEK